MPFTLPTLRELAERSAGAFRANLKGSDAQLWPNNVAVTSKVIAGAVWEAFGFLEYIKRQILVQTADSQFLERHAAEYGMARLSASQAEGEIIFTGDNNIAIPAGLLLVRADGVEYETLSSSNTFGTGEARVQVRARTAGKAGNTRPGVTLNLSQPIDQLSSQATVGALGIGGGADIENDAALRERVLFRKRMPPHGGAAHDYVIWARERPGVTRVFVDPVNALNERTTIGVWFLMDDTYANGIPQGADVTAMEDHIDGLRPAGAVVDISAPTAVTVNIVIDNLQPDTQDVREAVKAELADLFRRSMKVSTLTDPFILRVSKIWEAISVASGEDSHSLTTPAADIADLTAGQIPVLGTVTFT